MDLFLLLKLVAARRGFHKHDKWTREELERHQRAGLKTLRDFAYERSPFYKKFHAGLEDAPLQDLPVLTKAELMKHWDEVVTDPGLKLDEVKKFVEGMRGSELFKDKYYAVTTGGSSGLKGVFAYDREEWLTVLLSYSRANDWAGVQAGLTKPLKLAVVSTTTPWHQSAVVGATLKSPFVPALRIDSTDPMGSKVARLNDFQPRSLVAYAGEAKALAEEQLAGRLRISPQAVFCASEVLTKDAIKSIQDAWGVRPFNVFAATETAGIASECPAHDGLHMYEDLLIIEVVDKDNRPVKPGEYGYKLLVTVLFSRTIPLIRYELTDSVRLSPEKCPDECSCGLPFGKIDSVQGRAEDIIYLADIAGNKIPIQPNLFNNALEFTPIGGWRIVQEPDNRLKVLVIGPQKGYEEANLVKALTEALEKQGAHEPTISMEYVKSFDRTAIGKTYLIKALK